MHEFGEWLISPKVGKSESRKEAAACFFSPTSTTFTTSATFLQPLQLITTFTTA